MKCIHFPLNTNYSSVGLVLPYTLEDNSGVAHVLEHLLLCGSDRYPYDDLFFTARANHVLVDMNAATYANGLILHATAWDSSELESIKDVYLSLFEQPLLRECDFRREGVHLRNAKPNGIVYNEMYNENLSPRYDPLQSAYRHIFDDGRQYNANGSPDELIHLSHERLLAFWEKSCRIEDAVLITGGSFGEDDSNTPSASNTNAVQPINRHITVIDAHTSYEAHLLAEATNPTEYLDGAIIKGLLLELEDGTTIDERNLDLLVLFQREHNPTDRLIKLADNSIIGAIVDRYIQPGDRFRPSPLVWLNRIAAQYLGGTAPQSAEAAFELIQQRLHKWRNPRWREECIAARLQSPSQEIECQRTSPVQPSAQRYTQETHRPVLFRKQRPSAENPYRLRTFYPTSITLNTQPTLAEILTKIVESTHTPEEVIKDGGKNARYGAVSMTINTRTAADEAALHLLAAYWTLFFLHPQIRRQNGAYGAVARVGHDPRRLLLLSYRDPEVKQSVLLMASLIEEQQSIADEESFCLSQRSVLSQLSPRGALVGQFANGELIKNQQEWQHLSNVWQEVARTNLQTTNRLLAKHFEDGRVTAATT